MVVVKKRPKTAVTVNNDKFIFGFLINLVLNEISDVLSITIMWKSIKKM